MWNGSVDKLGDEIRDSALELRSDWRAIGRYMMLTEVHVYAFAIAANVLLAFWPFMLVMLSLFRNVFGWRAGELAIYGGVKDFFPGETGAFLAYNLKTYAGYLYKVEWLSWLLLLFTANGVFLPLEVALNRAWGVTENRSLLKNQAVSMGLILACGGLVLLSAMLSGGGQLLWSGLTGQGLAQLDAELTGSWTARPVPLVVLGLSKLASIPLTFLSLFLVFSYLPNTKIPKRLIVPRVVVIGLILESLKWINLAIWPWVYSKLSREYGVFVNSVTILTWSFLAGLVVLAGAEWTARHARNQAALSVKSEPFQDRIDSESVR